MHTSAISYESVFVILCVDACTMLVALVAAASTATPGVLSDTTPANSSAATAGFPAEER